MLKWWWWSFRKGLLRKRRAAEQCALREFCSYWIYAFIYEISAKSYSYLGRYFYIYWVRSGYAICCFGFNFTHPLSGLAICLYSYSFILLPFVARLACLPSPLSFPLSLSLLLCFFSACLSFFWAEFKIYLQQTRNLVLALTAQLSSASPRSTLSSLPSP